MASFYKNVGSMALGFGGSQFILLLAAPIIARLYSPEDFGVAALFASVAAIAVIPTTLRLEHAIVLPKDDNESFKIISVAVFALMAFCVASLLLLIGIYISGISAITTSHLGVAVFLLPFALFFLGAGNIATGCAARTKSFKAVGRGNMIQSASIVSSRIALGLVSGSSAIVLIVTVLLGTFLKVTTLIRAINYSVKSLLVVPTLHDFKQIIREYRQFPLYSIPTGLLRSFNDNLPVLLLATLFTPQVVGLFAMANRLIKAPVTVIREPIRLAYLQKSSEMVQQGKPLAESLLVLTLALSLLAAVIIFPLVFYGRELFQLILGDKWVDAGTYAAIVSPWFASVFVQTPSSCIYIVYHKQKYLMLLQGAATIMMIISALAVHILQLDVIAALTALSVVGTVLNLLLVLNAFFLLRKLQVPNGVA